MRQPAHSRTNREKGHRNIEDHSTTMKTNHTHKALLGLADKRVPGAALREVRLRRHPALLRLVEKRQYAAGRMSALAGNGMPCGGKVGRRFSKWWNAYEKLEARISKLREHLVDVSLHEICVHVEILQSTPGYENINANLERMENAARNFGQAAQRAAAPRNTAFGFCGIGKPVEKKPGRRTMKGTDLDNLSL